MTDSTDMEIYQEIMGARTACENLKMKKAHPLNLDLPSAIFSTHIYDANV